MSSELDGRGYSRAVEHLEPFGAALRGLVFEVLRAKGLAVHSVDYRVKKWDSATRKVSLGEDKYSGIDDLKDLLGVRVITYFEDDVDKVAKVLVPEFSIDKEHSVDKRSLLDPDQFGYMSLHYVAKLHQKRIQLVEYQRFEHLCFEIQIRSILQHAWAEIEHDLGYKAEGTVPRDVRRRFSRLAGLLELADDEFTRLREDLTRYEKRVKAAIRQRPSTLALDQSTLAVFLETPEILELDREVAAHFPASVAEDVDVQYASRSARDLSRLHVRDIQTLSQLVSERHEHLVKYAEHWVGHKDIHREKPLQRGISLFYLGYTLVATAEPSARTEWFEGRANRERAEALLRRIEDTWAKVVSDLGDPPKWEPKVGGAEADVS